MVLVIGRLGDGPDPTVRFRGSQKSKSCSEMTDRGYGEGEGESEGQLVADRSSMVLAFPLLISEFGWMNTRSTKKKSAIRYSQNIKL